MQSTDNWFKDWFNTPFYHILYGNRNESEADVFISNILKHLKLEPGSRVLDLACGKGRHSRMLAKNDLDVTGIDLSEASIKLAKANECSHLHFAVHDMREPYKHNYFDCIFNLFTSFGYFEDKQDNLRTIKAVQEELKTGGYFILDFFNSSKIISKLQPHEIKTIEGITFNIEKRVEQGYIIKTISFDHQGQAYRFRERVQALNLDDFQNLFKAASLEIKSLFGDYALNPFDPEQSDRLIIIAREN